MVCLCVSVLCSYHDDDIDLVQSPAIFRCLPPTPLPRAVLCVLCSCSYRDDDIDMVQSAAILRYLGRKHAMYGVPGDKLGAARMDQLLDGELSWHVLCCAVLWFYSADLTPRPDTMGSTANKNFALRAALARWLTWPNAGLLV